MSAFRIPLRAGQRAGSPVVTWAPGSAIDVSANATTVVQARTVPAVVIDVDGAANGQLQLTIAHTGVMAGPGISAAAMRGVRAVKGVGQLVALSIVSLHSSSWAPQQPERRVTYRRYSRADYQQMLMDLLPRGRAWPRDGEDADLMLGWATEQARIEQRGWDLLNEIDPRTTHELMPDWERFFELPGTASDEQRRKELIAEWLAGGTLSRDDIADLLNVLGITASVHYWRPFRCGVSVCGDALATEWYSTWTVTVYAPQDIDLIWLQDYLRKLAPGGDWVHVVAGY